MAFSKITKYMYTHTNNTRTQTECKSECCQCYILLILFQIWNPSVRHDLLECLSHLFMEELGINIGVTFRPLLIDIVSRCRDRLAKENTVLNGTHQKFSIALSKCLYWPDIKR